MKLTFTRLEFVDSFQKHYPKCVQKWKGMDTERKMQVIGGELHYQWNVSGRDNQPLVLLCIQWIDEQIRHDKSSQHPPLPVGYQPTNPSLSNTAQEQQKTDNMGNKYASTPIATPTLVYGRDVADMNEGELQNGIKASLATIKSLTELGVESTYIAQQVAAQKEVVALYVKFLDKFAAPVAPAAPVA